LQSQPEPEPERLPQPEPRSGSGSDALPRPQRWPRPPPPEPEPEPERAAAMKRHATFNDVKVYNVSAGKSLPEWTEVHCSSAERPRPLARARR